MPPSCSCEQQKIKQKVRQSPAPCRRPGYATALPAFGSSLSGHCCLPIYPTRPLSLSALLFSAAYFCPVPSNSPRPICQRTAIVTSSCITQLGQSTRSPGNPRASSAREVEANETKVFCIRTPTSPLFPRWGRIEHRSVGP